MNRYDVGLPQISPLYRVLCGGLALLYGGVLASFPLDVFKDRENYLAYAENAWFILTSFWDINPLAVLANEPVWLIINAGFGMFFSPEETLRLIVFFPATLVAYAVLVQSQNNFWWLLLILFIPQVIKNHIIHLRQGVAVSFFIFGWLNKKSHFRRILIILTPFIHASFFIVLLLFFFSKLLCRLRFSWDIRSFIFVGLGIGVGAGLSWSASYLGARQAEHYAFVAANVSGLGFLFWSGILVLMALQGRAFMRRFAFELGAIIFYLATYFSIEVTARIFESTILLVFLAGMSLTGWRRITYLSSIIIFGCFSWVLRAGDPWMGFGNI